MPRLRTTLSLSLLALLFCVGATALLSGVQRLDGAVTLDAVSAPDKASDVPPPRTRQRHRPQPAAQIETAAAPVSPPVPVTTPPPRYPIAALRAHREGVVMVRVELDAGGRVVDARVSASSGDAQLDEAAVEATRRWTFRRPPGSAGSAVVPVRFRIDG